MTIDTGVMNRYVFSLLSLLSLIETSGAEKVLVIGGQWLDWNSVLCWNQEARAVIQRQYSKAKYNISVRFIKQVQYVNKEYHCVIEKRK